MNREMKPLLGRQLPGLRLLSGSGRDPCLGASRLLAGQGSKVKGAQPSVVFSVSPVHSFSFTASGYLGAEGVRDALSGHLLQAKERKGRCTPLSLLQRPEVFSVGYPDACFFYS